MNAKDLDKKTLVALKEYVENVRVISGSPVSSVTPDELDFVWTSPLCDAPHTELICRAVSEFLDGFIEEVDISTGE